MTTPLRMAFDVSCSVEHAFDVWTTRIGTWWPSDHTISGETDLSVVMERGVGGRIYERTADGTEHDWGEITVWLPPTRLEYLWHLRRDPRDATEVSVSFVARGAAETRVEIEQRGWERLADGAQWRDRNVVGWESVLPHYVRWIAKER